MLQRALPCNNIRCCVACSIRRAFSARQRRGYLQISARLEEMSKAIEGGGMSMSNFTQAVEAAVEKAGGMQAVIDDPTGDKMREVEKLLPQELQVRVARSGRSVWTPDK